MGQDHVQDGFSLVETYCLHSPIHSTEKYNSIVCVCVCVCVQSLEGEFDRKESCHAAHQDVHEGVTRFH